MGVITLCALLIVPGAASASKRADDGPKCADRVNASDAYKNAKSKPDSCERNRKVKLCNNGHTIKVSKNAVPAHKAHGDELGECERPDYGGKPSEDQHHGEDRSKGDDEPKPDDKPQTDEKPKANKGKGKEKY